jgi:hypothetical protein
LQSYVLLAFNLAVAAYSQAVDLVELGLFTIDRHLEEFTALDLTQPYLKEPVRLSLLLFLGQESKV